MIKKFLVLVFVMILTVGCTRDKRPVLQFASWGSQSEVEILKPLLDEFQNENPDVNLQFMHIPQNYFQKIHLLFASNMAPDVIFVNDLYLPIYANAGLLEDLTQYFNTDEFYEKSLLKWNGKVYAIPRDVSNLVIYYNQDLFDKFGVPYPKKSWDFENFLKKAKKLTHKPDVYGVSFEEDLLFYLPYLMSEGGGVLSDDLSKKIVNEPQSQKGLQFYADLRNKYGVAPKKSESASATMAQMFLQEKIAMHVSGRWLVPKYRKDAKFRWDVINFPAGDAGSIVPMDASGWAVAKSSKNKDAAIRLVKFLSSKASIEKIAESGLIVPARKDVKSDNPVFNWVIETSKITPVSLDYKEIQDDMKSRTEALFNKN